MNLVGFNWAATLLIAMCVTFGSEVPLEPSAMHASIRRMQLTKACFAAIA